MPRMKKYDKETGKWIPVAAGGKSGADDYAELTNKPQINGVELLGDKTLDDLGIVLKNGTPDWNQNDPNSPNYIKNRFGGYTKPDSYTLLGKKDYNFAIDPTVGFADLYTCSIPVEDEPFNLWLSQNDGVTEEAIAKLIWEISWDGVIYKPKLDLENFMVGNLSLLDCGPDTKEPFVIEIAGCFNVSTKETKGTHNIQITTIGNINVLIPDKFLSAAGKKQVMNGEIFNDYESNRASGMYSHAEGYATGATEYASHAEGSYTEALGDYAHAEGNNTIASGNSAHAEGGDTIASGVHTHAEGCGTKASGANQHVQGVYNIEDAASKYAHIVGNGGYKAHSNAHTLDWNGNSWYQGDVLIGGKDMDDPNAISLKKLHDEIVPAKLDKNQGAENNGKILGIDELGEVVPVVKPEGGTAELQPLTFTGAVEATYTGVEPITVDIPSAGGGSGLPTNAKLIAECKGDGISNEIVADAVIEDGLYLALIVFVNPNQGTSTPAVIKANIGRQSLYDDLPIFQIQQVEKTYASRCAFTMIKIEQDKVYTMMFNVPGANCMITYGNYTPLYGTPVRREPKSISMISNSPIPNNIIFGLYKFV